MRAEDQQVVRVDQSLLGIAAEEIFGMIDEVLVQWAARRHVDRRRRPSPATGPPNLLPGACDRAGIAAEHGGIEVADIDAQLERVRADHAAHRTIAESVLDLAPLQRQVATAVAADRAVLPEPIRERLLQVAKEDLHLQPSSSKDDGLHSAAPEGLGA